MKKRRTLAPVDRGQFLQAADKRGRSQQPWWWWLGMILCASITYHVLDYSWVHYDAVAFCVIACHGAVGLFFRGAVLVLAATWMALFHLSPAAQMGAALVELGWLARYGLRHVSDRLALRHASDRLALWQRWYDDGRFHGGMVAGVLLALCVTDWTAAWIAWNVLCVWHVFLSGVQHHWMQRVTTHGSRFSLLPLFFVIQPARLLNAHPKASCAYHVVQMFVVVLRYLTSWAPLHTENAIGTGPFVLNVAVGSLCVNWIMARHARSGVTVAAGAGTENHVSSRRQKRDEPTFELVAPVQKWKQDIMHTRVSMEARSSDDGLNASEMTPTQTSLAEAGVSELVQTHQREMERQKAETARQRRQLKDMRTAQERAQASANHMMQQVRQLEKRLMACEAQRDALQKQNTELHKNVSLCIICYERAPDCGLQCGHLLCWGCARQVQRCPTCRTAVQSRIKLYIG